MAVQIEKRVSVEYKMHKFKNIVRSLLIWLISTLFIIITFPMTLLVWLLTVLFDKRLYLLHKTTSFIGATLLWMNPLWNLTVEGRDRINPDKVYVMVSNHQSLLDIMVLYSLHTHFKWISKTENFKTPIVGWTMTLNRYIKVERGSSKGAFKMIQEADKTLQLGSSLMIFPEGTRSADGKLGRFKEGAFVLALNNSLPILPIVIDGTAEALPKEGFVLHSRKSIKVKVLDEISPELFVNMNSRELASFVRTKIAEALKEIRQIY
jgi:1-acyl-sn-glycerol-3-phosphate acyltransferase